MLIYYSPTFNLKDYQTDIEYDVQNTEKDGLYGSVSGLDKIVVNAKLLVRMGVFNNSKEVSFKKMKELKRGVGYYDVNSIVKKDDYTELLSMIDWSEFEDQKASQVEVTRFYCNTIGEIITVNRQYYSEHGGRGNVAGGADDFEPGSYTVTPSTHYEHLWEVACNTKLVFSQPDKESLPNNELNISKIQEYVTDKTESLTDEQIDKLKGKLAAFEKLNGSQIAVLIVPSTESEDITQYALRIANSSGLGRKNFDDGVLILIAKNDRKVNIAVGMGLENKISNPSAKQIINEVLSPYLKRNDFYSGINEAINRLMFLVVDNKPVEIMAYEDKKRAERDALDAAPDKINSETVAKEKDPSEEERNANIKTNFNNGINGAFEITSLGDSKATFAFLGQTSDHSAADRQYFEVEAPLGQDVRRVVVRRMTSLIREHYQGDFDWESHRLNRTIVKSARVEDSAELEEFLMQEFFGQNYKTQLMRSAK